jgi:glutamine synthetase
MPRDARERLIGHKESLMTGRIAGKRLRLLWSDLLGLERGKYLYGKKAEAGHSNFAVTTFATTLHKAILPIPGLAYDVGLPDMQARCDFTSLRESWEKDTLVGVGDLFHNQRPLAIDPRQILRQACSPWIEKGLHPQLAFEFEFYLLRPDGHGRFAPLDAPGSRVYGTGTAVDPELIVDSIVATAVECGFPVEAWCSEFDDSQFEVNLGYRDAVAAADDAFLFRNLIRELSLRRGLRATFLGKPFVDRAGSGLHVNLSFRAADGDNALCDPSTEDGLSALAHRCIGGMLAHHQGLAAVLAPNVNAYKRLRPDMMNGYWANWGYDDRTVAVRISPERGPSTRLEHRTADGAANPYLVAAALLHAARFGVEREIAPPAHQPLGQAPKGAVSIPASLHDAIEAFAADGALCAALGPEFVRTFTMMKRAEWGRYLEAVAEPSAKPSDWELSYYLPFF